MYGRPATNNDKLSGPKQNRSKQRIPNRIHIQFKLPQEILQDLHTRQPVIEEIFFGGPEKQNPPDGRSSGYNPVSRARRET